MQRSEFLSKLGLGLVAVCAGYSLASCSGGSKNDPTPNNGDPALGSANTFSIDLSSQIISPGDFTIQGSIILVRLASGNSLDSFTAVQSICTHDGTIIGYNHAQDRFICPTDGSQFSDSGDVLLRQAGKALQKYLITISGTVLTVIV